MKKSATNIADILPEPPCFQLVYTNGEPVDTGDSIPHYLTAEKAAEAADRFHLAPLGTPRPEQLTAPCVSVSCTGCGYVLDEDDAMIHHFLPGEVEAALKDWEWKVDGERRLCPKCVKETGI
jgi:hypothetical protein